MKPGNFFNKHRIALSRLFGVIFLILLFYTKPIIKLTNFSKEIHEVIAFVCLVICTLGRLLANTFIAGRKDVEIVQDGPFSIVRNPLYCSSFIGAIGVGLLTERLELLCLLIFAFILYYFIIIRNEENFLAAKHPQIYAEYRQRVPAILPKFSLWRLPEHITIETKALLHAYRDIPWFLVVFLIYELWEDFIR